MININKERGGILIMVLMVLFILLLFSMTFYYLTTSQIIMTSHQEELNRVKIGAESAAVMAINQYREIAMEKFREFATQWNTDHEGDPVFVRPTNAPTAGSFIEQYVNIIEKIFEDYGDPMNQGIELNIDGFDHHEITDLKTFLIINNSPITIDGADGSPDASATALIHARWNHTTSFSNDHSWDGISGDISFTDSQEFAFQITLPYRVIAMAGTEETAGRFLSQFHIIEQGEMVLNLNRRILNQWVLCSEKHRGTNNNPDTWRDAVWFVHFHTFWGPVHTNDHHNIWGRPGQPPPIFSRITSANRFPNSYHRDDAENFPWGYMPMGAWSRNLSGANYRNTIFSGSNRLRASDFDGHDIIAVDNPVIDEVDAFIDTVSYPENTHDQRLRSVCDISEDDTGIDWGSFSTTTVNVDDGYLTDINIDGTNHQTKVHKVRGGIYVPGDTEYVRFSIVSTRNDDIADRLYPWEKQVLIYDNEGNHIDTKHVPIDDSPIHNFSYINNTLGLELDNGYQKIEIKQGDTITQILVRDENYQHGGVNYNNQYTYVRSRSASGTADWTNRYWREYEGTLNGMLYVHGNIGENIAVRNSKGLSGVVSGNLQPVIDADGTLYYGSRSQWNVTAYKDIVIENNILYSYYGNPNAVSFDEDPNSGFNPHNIPYPYNYGDFYDELPEIPIPEYLNRGFYIFDNTLFRQLSNNRFIHQNMLGILTTGGNIYHNPNIPQSPNGRDLYIDAFLMATEDEKGLIKVYKRGNSAWGTNDRGAVRLRGGYLTWLYGAHISNNYGFGRTFVWDERATDIAPPYWPIEQAYNQPPRPNLLNVRRKPLDTSGIVSWPPSSDSPFFNSDLNSL